MKSKTPEDTFGIGEPATVSIGSDSYAASVESFSETRKTVTVMFLHERKMFRWSTKYKSYKSDCYFLNVGFAHDRRSREF